jgi:diguanylate cyclase (GGDEF)-like protein/PAS domain S-box-containing protein
LFGISNQPAFACDSETLAILDANDVAASTFGFTRRRLLGVKLSTLVAPDDLSDLTRTMSAVGRTGLSPILLRVATRHDVTATLEGFATSITYNGCRAVMMIANVCTDPIAPRAPPAGTADRDQGADTALRRQKALTDFTRSALSNLTPRELLQAAARLLKDSLALDFCLGFELRETEGDLVCRAAEGWTGDLNSLHFDPAGQTLAARSMRSRSPVMIQDAQTEMLPVESAWFFDRYSLKAAIGIPIRLGDTSYGSLVAYSCQPRRFTEEEIRDIETAADVIAMADDRERSKTEAALAAQRIGDVLESIVEHFVHVDHEWKIGFVNITVIELFSQPAQSMIGQPVEESFPSFKDPSYRPYYEDAMYRGHASMFEMHSALNNHWYETRVRPMPEGIGVYYLDITDRRNAEDARLDHERRIGRLIASMPAITWMTDADLTIVTSIGGGLARLGLKDDELAGRNLRAMFQEPANATIAAHEAALAGNPADYTDTLTGRVFHSHVEPMWNEQGAVTGVAGLTIDITDRVTAEQRLVEAQALAHFGTWGFSDGELSYSDELLRIYGRIAGEMPSDVRGLSKVVHPEDVDKLWDAIEYANEKNQSWSVGHRILRPDGTVRYVHNVGRYLIGPDGHAIAGAGSILDVTSRKITELQMTRLANFDALTGLPNRLKVVQRLGEAMETARRTDRRVAVGCIDVDRFKQINDTLGHAVGDALLTAIGARLKAGLPAALVGRLGSDVFIVLFPSVADRSELDGLCRATQDLFATPFDIVGRDIFVRVSGGFASYPDDGADPDSLMRSADIALHRAKESGGSSLSIFSADMIRTDSTHLDFHNSLHRAVERSEFTLQFQPIVTSSGRRLVGLEALVRWAHPTLGLVPPDRFIPLAEETGLIVPIGEYVLKSACSFAAARWRTTNGRHSISVNLSARQFADPGLVRLIESTLSESGLAPAALCLEITESAVIRDMLKGAATLRTIRAMGVKIAVDDFGTGYSSLSYLRSFEFDILKIDKTFIAGVTEHPGDDSIVRGILALGHALDLSVTAEGVETEAQARFLEAEGCDSLQGYLIGRPVDCDDVDAAIRRFE